MRHLLFNNTAVADAAADAYSYPSELPKAQIGIFDAQAGGSLDLTGANATDEMIIAQGVSAGKSPVRTHVLEKGKIEKVVTKAYEAPVRQVTFVGYNGTNGDIEAGAGDYFLKTVDVTNGYEPYPTMSANYFTKSVGVIPFTIATEIAKVDIKNPRFFVQVDVVSELTTAVLNNGSASATDVSIIQGSDQATFGDAANLSAGDYVRIGHATDTGYPVYYVKALDGDVATLGRPFAGETVSDVAVGFTSTAPDADDASGLKLTGATPAPDNNEGIEIDTEDQVTSFRTALSEDFGSTPLTSSAAPVTGSGSYLQVANMEKNTQGFQSFFYRATPFEAEKPEFFADSDLTYDLVTILYRTNTTENIAKSNKYVEIS